MPSLRAVPAMTSSTARTGPPEVTSASESGSVFSAIRRMRPSPRMKIISRGMYVFFIQKLVGCSRWKSNSIPCPSGSCRRDSRPFACPPGVEAISTANTCTPFLVVISSGCRPLAAGAWAGAASNGNGNRNDSAAATTSRRRRMGTASFDCRYHTKTRRLRVAAKIRGRWAFSVGCRTERHPFGAYIGRHQALRARPKSHENELSRPQSGQTETAQGLHVHENVGRALAAGEETEAAQPVEPLHLRPLERAGRRDGDVGARRGHLRRVHRRRIVHGENTE